MATTNWFIDSVHSSVEFEVQHLMISTYRSRFRTVKGAVVLDDENPSASSLRAEIDVRSIDADDPGLRDKLMGEGFFHAEKHPSITFKSTRVAKVDERHWTADGELSLAGVTRPATLAIEALGGATNPFAQRPMRAFRARTRIDRGEYGFKWNVPLEGGGVYLGEAIQVDLQIELLRET